MTETDVSPDDKFAAFKIPSFARYFTARFFTSFATQIVAATVYWQIWIETDSELLLGLIGLVQFLPALLLVLVTGLASDRLGRRMVMGLSIIAELICVSILIWITLSGVFSLGLVFGVLLMFGTSRAFFAPASSSLVVNIVPEKVFPNAAGFVSSSWQLASIVGPAVSGFLIAVSIPFSYGVAAVMFAVSAILIWSIPKPSQKAPRKESPLESLLGGFSYIFKQRVVLGAISLDMFAVLLGGAVALLPVFATDILGLGETGYGFLRAAPGVGALIMLGIITAFPIKDHAGKILLVFVALFGAATAGFGASTVAWLSFVLLFLVGAFDMVSVYIREVLLQLWTPDDVRGRVNAVNSIFLGASNELGEFRAGLMAAFLGPVFTVVFGGVAAVGVAGLWAILFPKMRDIRYLKIPDKDDVLLIPEEEDGTSGL